MKEFFFKLINWNHFRHMDSNYKIIEIRGFRTAVIDGYGQRKISRFYWTIFGYNI